MEAHQCAIHLLFDKILRFKLSMETLFLSTSLFYKYIRITKPPQSQFKMTAIACLFIASKFEDSSPPHLSELIDEGFWYIKYVLRLERDILMKIKYQVAVPTIYTALQFKYGNDEDYFNMKCKQACCLLKKGWSLYDIGWITDVVL
jgi:hypothetical protein